MPSIFPAAMPVAPEADWAGLLAPFGAPAAVVAAAFADVAARHAEAHRRYHTLAHVGEVLAVVDRLAHRAADPVAVRLAAWLHDVVYDPQSSTNEADSAAYARARLPHLGVPPVQVDGVARLVELTATHRAARGDADGAVLADADLAVLGSPPERYRRYRADVRAEYGWLDDDGWRAGRAAVVGDLLARPRLFHTDEAEASLDERARANLERELATLTSPDA